MAHGTIGDMSRCADPERIHQARRAAIRNTLESRGMDRETAERWYDAWELEAVDRGLRKDRDYRQTGAGRRPSGRTRDVQERRPREVGVRVEWNVGMNANPHPL